MCASMGKLKFFPINEATYLKWSTHSFCYVTKDFFLYVVVCCKSKVINEWAEMNISLSHVSVCSKVTMIKNNTYI